MLDQCVLSYITIRAQRFVDPASCIWNPASIDEIEADRPTVGTGTSDNTTLFNQTIQTQSISVQRIIEL